MKKKAKELLPLLTTHGRTLFDEDRKALFFNWTCSGFTVAFSGTRLSARMTALGDKIPPMPGFPEPPVDWPCFGVVTENGELENRTECREEDAPFTLWEGAPGEHSLRVVKLSENARGKLGLLELETDGEFLPAPANKRPVVEFVGDSITCGFGNEAADNDMVFRTREENGWTSYGALAARELGCEWSMICESGIAVSRPEREIFPMHAMDEIYAFTDELFDSKRGAEPAQWDFAARRSDIVVINLGTNDATPIRFYRDASEIEPMELHFQQKYKAFLKEVRRLNGPDALIVCSLGSMDYYLYDRLLAAVNEYKEETGDGKIVPFKFVAINFLTEGYGGGAHPSSKTHARMGAQLASFLRPYVDKVKKERER